MADRHQVGRRLLETGARALRQRRPARAGEAFQAALTVFGGPDMGMARGHALRGMAEAAAAASDPERALHLLDLARTEYRWLRTLLAELAIDDDLRELSRVRAIEAEAIALVIEANIALVRGDVKVAHDRVNSAYPMFREIGGPPSSSNLWDTTARIASWEGRHVAAIRAWEKALKLLADQKDLRARCLTGLRLAEAYLAVSRLDAARERLEEAEQLAREFEEPGLTGRVFLGWGTWHARHDAFEAALDAYEDALAAFREGGDADQALTTQIRAARVASRSGRMEVVGRIRDALERLSAPGAGDRSRESHPTALGTVLALMAEHALGVGRPEVTLVAVEAARRFWGEREPVDGQAPLLRLAVRALAELGDARSATTVVHQLAACVGEGNAGAMALRDAWRRRAPAEWLTQLDNLAPETLAAQTDAVIQQVFVRWSGRLGLEAHEQGTVKGALALCGQLPDRAASVAVDDRQGGAAGPVLIWEAGGSERQQTALSKGITTLGRALDNDIAVPWDAAVAEVQCVLQRDGGEVRLVMPEGQNGVTVDGQPVHGEHLLQGGERIAIGANVLRFQVGGAPAGASVGAVAVAVAVPRP